MPRGNFSVRAVAEQVAFGRDQATLWRMSVDWACVNCWTLSHTHTYTYTYTHIPADYHFISDTHSYKSQPAGKHERQWDAHSLVAQSARCVHCVTKIFCCGALRCLLTLPVFSHAWAAAANLCWTFASVVIGRSLFFFKCPTPCSYIFKLKWHSGQKKGCELWKLCRRKKLEVRYVNYLLKVLVDFVLPKLCNIIEVEYLFLMH